MHIWNSFVLQIQLYIGTDPSKHHTEDYLNQNHYSCRPYMKKKKIRNNSFKSILLILLQ